MYKPTFYYLFPKMTDNEGLTPGYRGFFQAALGMDEFHQYDRGRGFVNLKADSREGPPRLYEVPRFDASIYPLLLVSEQVKEFLEQLQLPRHQFLPATLEHSKLTTDKKFYLFQIKKDTLFEYLDWKNTDFYYSLSRNKKVQDGKKIDTKLSSKEEYLEERNSLRKRFKARTLPLLPGAFIQTAHFDFVTYADSRITGKVILVPDYIKAAFERHFPDQVGFKKVEMLDILVDEKAYLERKAAVESLNFTAENTAVELDEQFLLYAEKMERLMSGNVLLPDDYEGTDEFSDKERELKKIFPPEFKEFYRNPVPLRNFTLEPIKFFYLEGNYQTTHPQTCGAVIFAGDGSGEGIGLLLKADSDVELDPQWYYFSHEDGEVYPINLSDLTE